MTLSALELETIAATFRPYQYWAFLRRALDADTYELDIDQGLCGWAREHVRLVGIDTWEVNGPDRAKGEAARTAVTLLLEGKLLELRTFKAPRAALQTRSFTRWVGHIRIHDSQIDVADWLRANGFEKAAPLPQVASSA